MTIELDDRAAGAGAHLVQFYEQDSELAGAVGRYLLDGFEDGGIAIIIATEAHRRAIEDELRAGGVDPQRRRRDGTMIVLDAAQTTARLVEEGLVCETEFRRIVGSVVRDAAASGRPVRAYGEMVALLWDAGNVPAAIELEKAWNDLAAEVPFDLLCGYRTESVQADHHAEALHEICQLHSGVIGRPAVEATQGVRAQFSGEPRSAREARRFVAEALAKWGDTADLFDDAQLVVSELATNAILHARAPFSVELRPGDNGRLRLAVHDPSQLGPVLRDPDPLARSGRGLHLVGTLASDWGVEVQADGKTVWAELQSG